MRSNCTLSTEGDRARPDRCLLEPPEPSVAMQPVMTPTTFGTTPDTRPMMILIAGPYRGGTGDDPEKMAANLRRLEEVSWPLFAAGHIPMIGEWVALPVWRSAGGSE